MQLEDSKISLYICCYVIKWLEQLNQGKKKSKKPTKPYPLWKI